MINVISKDPKFKPLLNMFTDEYGTMLKVLSSQDYDFANCLLKAHGKHLTTHGDAYLHEKSGKLTCSSPVLTNKSDSMSRQTLDYIFQVRTKAKLQDTSCYQVDWSQTKVEKFKAEKHFLFCSDHFGVSTVLN